jgi:hypothetical protein
VTVDVSTPEKPLKTLQATAQALADGKTDRSTANGVFYAVVTSVQVHKITGHEKRIRVLEIKLGLREGDADESA